MARKASATCPAVKEEYPLTSWKLTASLLACLKAVASWSALLPLSCFVQCLLQASDLSYSAVHGSEPSPLLSLKVTWIWGGSSAFRRKAWAPAAPLVRELWHHCLNSVLDLLSTAYCASFWKTATSPITTDGFEVPHVTN